MSSFAHRCRRPACERRPVMTAEALENSAYCGHRAPGPVIEPAGILERVNRPSPGGALPSTASMSIFGEWARNARLLGQAALQHLMDDPAHLAIQANRKLPYRYRTAAGNLLALTAPLFPSLAALGHVMTGRLATAERTLQRVRCTPVPSRSRLAGEVAILLDRDDLLPDEAPASTRARAAWVRGDLTRAIAILEAAGQGDRRHARRLASEIALLQPDFRLPTRTAPTPRTPADDIDGGIRVLHLLTNSLPYTQSGYSLRSHRILLELRAQGICSLALTRTGYPVMVGFPLAAGEDVVDGVRYVRTLPPALPQTQEEKLQAQVERALQLVEEFRPHVIHTTTNYQNALVAQAVSEATGLPWVFEVRGLMEQTWVASHRSAERREHAAGSEKYRLISAKESEQAVDASAVLTLSTTMAETLARRGVAPESITLVPNGVDPSLFHEHVSPREARRITGLSTHPGFGTDAFIVGAVSALVDYEGHDSLLRAVALIVHGNHVPASLRERVRVVLVGDGISRPALDSIAADLGIADRVHMPGRVPREEARRWVESLDVVAVPRRDVAVTRTVTPQKPIEAMALSRPVIASDVEALREVASNGDGTACAILVPPEDPHALAEAIIRVATSPSTYETLRSLAQDLAYDRAWPLQIERYRQVYETITASTIGGGAHGQ